MFCRKPKTPYLVKREFALGKEKVLYSFDPFAISKQYFSIVRALSQDEKKLLESADAYAQHFMELTVLVFGKEAAHAISEHYQGSSVAMVNDVTKHIAQYVAPAIRLASSAKKVQFKKQKAAQRNLSNRRWFGANP